MCVLQDRGGGGGDEGQKKFVYLKWASHFWLYSKFHFLPEEFFCGFGWVGGSAWGGGVRQIPPPRPPPPVDKQDPGENAPLIEGQGERGAIRP